MERIRAEKRSQSGVSSPHAPQERERARYDACAYAQLAAAALGLGSVRVGAFDESDVCHAVDAIIDALPVAILPVGYARAAGERTARRPLGDELAARGVAPPRTARSWFARRAARRPVSHAAEARSHAA